MKDSQCLSNMCTRKVDGNYIIFFATPPRKSTKMGKEKKNLEWHLQCFLRCMQTQKTSKNLKSVNSYLN